MNHSKYCQASNCYWTYRCEIFGVILIVIATLLTIATQSRIGIFMLFLIGLILCCHNCWAACFCHYHSLEKTTESMCHHHVHSPSTTPDDKHEAS